MKCKETESTVQDLMADSNFTSEREKDISDEVTRCLDDVFSVKKEMEYLEAYSRRENLIFTGIPETQDEDTDKELRSFLSSQLRMGDIENIQFQRVHRLGRNKSGTRPIIARFLRYSDREKIASYAFRLKGTNMFVFPDFPKGIQDSRKRQLHRLKKEKQECRKASFSKSKPDRLYIDGQLIPEFG
ncbi:hypothetical protein QZH41_007974 [Actinostola sp. cb2023]|nr:hypothetical protein QZH41_007974 [Actinostola sp. cb2023]